MQSCSTSLHSRIATQAAGGVVALLLALATIIGMPHGALAHHSPGHGGGPGGGSTEPDPPPPTTLDGGTIYYYESGTTNRQVHSIKPDGSDDTVIVGVGNEAGTKPSRMLHNGARWYVMARLVEGTDGFFPDGPAGGSLYELELVAEGGTAIPLTDNAGACIQIWGGGPGVRYNWVPDASGQADGAISWIGTRWADTDNNGSCDQIVDGGIFRGAISIDGVGNVSFSQPTAPEVTVALSNKTTRASNFAWAPDGQQVAYTDLSNKDIWVVNGLGQHTKVFTGRATSLSWSPDLDLNTTGLQTRIAFTGALVSNRGTDTERGTYTMLPNGSERVRIASANLPKKSQPNESHESVHWSPAGSQIIYTHRIHQSLHSIISRVHRVNADATGNVVLVDANSVYRPHGMAWAVD